ncbi:LysR family transcriptional regulator [Crystallibacter degradans]|uniref:LysR family transcriptional regulator n=1 Tax=Crystallibacter degradans TaxID=2726743 RepID=UPI0014729AAC|nr:LysR family transcriptional regulator [Arthrobacter sp. SF27]NMR32241.1 LysR family transcriptional regulator [Arthrobacter sp. SF27]
MELREARYFLAVVRTKSFSKAARELQMTQPPLSQAIQKIERDTGLVLFERNSRTVTPTQAARAMVPEVESLLRRSQELDMLARRLRDHPTETLPPLIVRIGCVPSALIGFLPGIMPLISGVSPVIYEMNSVDQRRAIDRNEIDVGFLRDWPINDSRVRLLFTEPMVVVLPEKHPLAAFETVALADLSQEVFVLFPRETAPAAFDAITAACAGAGYAPNVQHLAANDQAIFGLVACGQGISLIPAMLGRLHFPGVVLRRLNTNDTAVPLGVIAPRNDPQRHGDVFYSAGIELIGQEQPWVAAPEKVQRPPS